MLSASTEGYILLGATGLIESVRDTVLDENHTHYVAALNLGAGVALGEGRLDLRVAQSLILGSADVAGVTTLSVGYGF